VTVVVPPSSSVNVWICSSSSSLVATGHLLGIGGAESAWTESLVAVALARSGIVEAESHSTLKGIALLNCGGVQDNHLVARDSKRRLKSGDFRVPLLQQPGQFRGTTYPSRTVVFAESRERGVELLDAIGKRVYFVLIYPTGRAGD